MNLFQNLSYIILVLVGFAVGYKLLQSLRFHVEPVLFVMTIAAFYIGRSSYLVKIFEFELMLSYALVSFFLGLLVGRLSFRFRLFRIRS